jgi:signal transduction histidine kinase/CheY-like chemotaxis protein
MGLGSPTPGIGRFFSIADNWRALLVASVLLAATWLTYGSQLHALNERAQADALVRASQLASSYQGDVSSTLKFVDNIIRLIGVYDTEQGSARTVRTVGRDRLYEGLAGNVAVVNAAGEGMAVGTAGSAPIALGDRSYFQAALRTRALVIGKPLVGRVTKRFAIPFARSVRDQDGHVIGAITAVIDVSSFAFGYGANDFGPKGLVEMVGTRDLVIRARTTGDGSPSIVGHMFSAAAPMLKRLSVARDGSYWYTPPTDHTLRVFAYKSVAGFPVIVLAGLAYNDIAAQTAGIGRTMLLTAWATTVVILGLLLVWRQQQLVRRDLRAANEAALAGTRAKSLFLANMSHEIRTPMNGVIGMADLALRTELTAEQRDYLSKIDYSAKSLLSVINDILDFSKIEAGRLELEEVRFEVASVMENIGGISALRAAEKGLRFEIRAGESVPGVLVGDAPRYGQVLLNLVSNGIKFTDAGSVLVTIEATPLTGDRVELTTTVRDTGMGMDDEAQSRLFQPFMQGDNSITRRFGGTGLGLTISKVLTERLGGRISFVSIPGAGSTFTFTSIFTVATDARGTKREPDAASEAVEYAGAHVLVAEDNQINLQIIERILRRYGITIEPALNGREAVEKALAPGAHYDAVLMDVQMPEMDGMEATRLIRRTLDAAHLPIIAMTAHAMEADRRLCLEAGMNDHLPKPLDPVAVGQMLRRWLVPRAPHAL